jgi:uncharacterized UPF0146 family protein
MRTYKHIELQIAAYIAERYCNVVEIGIGSNDTVASILRQQGVSVRAMDIQEVAADTSVRVFSDDIFSPRTGLYRGADLIYSIRPGIEMIPPMIVLARQIGCDLLVYHLGNEIYENGGEIIDCGITLHRYHAVQNPLNSVD